MAATALGTVCHHLEAETNVKSVKMSVFLATEGYQRELVLRPTAAAVIIEEPVGYGAVYTVTATAYQAVEGQTDDEPFVTADNSFIKPNYSSDIHWLAVSQDLLVHWGGKIKYGDQVQVCGVSPQLDGIYTVHDTMNKRHHHCIDILSNPSEKFDIFTKDVKIQRMAKTVAAKKPAAQPLLASNRLGRRGRLVGGVLRRSFISYAEQPTYLASVSW